MAELGNLIGGGNELVMHLSRSLSLFLSLSHSLSLSLSVHLSLSLSLRDITAGIQDRRVCTHNRGRAITLRCHNDQ